MADQTRARHPERVADGDGAAIDVELVRIDPQLAGAIQRLAGEGLVQLPKVDVMPKPHKPGLDCQLTREIRDEFAFDRLHRQNACPATSGSFQVKPSARPSAKSQ